MAQSSAASVVPSSIVEAETGVETQSAIEAKGNVGPYRQWNPSAIACYLRKANCEGCYYNGFFDQKAYGCHMAQAVQYLLKRVGPPEARHLRRAINQ